MPAVLFRKRDIRESLPSNGENTQAKRRTPPFDSGRCTATGLGSTWSGKHSCISLRTVDVQQICCVGHRLLRIRLAIKMATNLLAITHSSRLLLFLPMVYGSRLPGHELASVSCPGTASPSPAQTAIIIRKIPLCGLRDIQDS